MKTKISIILMLGIVVLMVSCRRTKMCVCEGTLNNHQEVLYFNVEHTFHCKDITRSGYETIHDTVHIRSMHNVTCSKYEE